MTTGIPERLVAWGALPGLITSLGRVAGRLSERHFLVQ
jgi:hypothetical protein